jgi:hypothetical protein
VMENGCHCILPGWLGCVRVSESRSLVLKNVVQTRLGTAPGDIGHGGRMGRARASALSQTHVVIHQRLAVDYTVSPTRQTVSA